MKASKGHAGTLGSFDGFQVGLFRKEFSDLFVRARQILDQLRKASDILGYIGVCRIIYGDNGKWKLL